MPMLFTSSNTKLCTGNLLLAFFVIQASCTRTAVGDLILSKDNGKKPTLAFPAQYGDGSDGDVTITGPTVNITDLFENDTVSGVTTARGVNKGLNKGSGSYDPRNGIYVKAVNFTINSGATLQAYARTTSDKQGVVWLSCIGKFTNNGAINLNGAGYPGGEGGYAYQVGGVNTSPSGLSGQGAGAGGGGARPAYYSGGNFAGGGGGGHAATGTAGGQFGSGTAGAAGLSYGSTDVPTNNWMHLYGSGGGGGSNQDAIAEVGGNGGNGGGALRIYAVTFVNNGTLSVNGTAGIESITTPKGTSGGGGSGGTIYLESINTLTLGTNVITALAGAGGGGDADEASGGNGAAGRIHIVGDFNGSTNPAAQ